MSRPIAVFFACALSIAVTAAGRSTTAFPDPPSEPAPASRTTQVAVLAGGCFWGMQGVFERLAGVQDVSAGYSGGEEKTAHYEIVSTGATGHAESIRIVYDPASISYGTLLKVFFSVAHDPTQLDYQGPDHGTQYRSVIFYATPEQKRVAEEYIRRLDAARVFPKLIVTQVVPMVAFYPAEEYHQHFLDKNPGYPYIVIWDLPKIAELERRYPTLVAAR